MRRKDLRPAKRLDDATFLRGAQRSATRAANRAERERRRQETLEELERERRRTTPVARPARPDA